MTTLYVKNFSPDKERKVRIFQLTKTGGFYSESPQVVPMDPLGASIGISLSKYIECEGTVNRGGMLISRNKKDINNISDYYNIRSDINNGNRKLFCELCFC